MKTFRIRKELSFGLILTSLIFIGVLVNAQPFEETTLFGDEINCSWEDKDDESEIKVALNLDDETQEINQDTKPEAKSDPQGKKESKENKSRDNKENKAKNDKKKEEKRNRGKQKEHNTRTHTITETETITVNGVVVKRTKTKKYYKGEEAPKPEKQAKPEKQKKQTEPKKSVERPKSEKQEKKDKQNKIEPAELERRKTKLKELALKDAKRNDENWKLSTCKSFRSCGAPRCSTNCGIMREMLRLGGLRVEDYCMLNEIKLVDAYSRLFKADYAKFSDNDFIHQIGKKYNATIEEIYKIINGK